VSVSVAIVGRCYCQSCCGLSLGSCRCAGEKVVDECVSRSVLWLMKEEDVVREVD
jgi:hypothetical protein